MEDFLRYLYTEKRYSKHTVSAYQNDLLQFRAFLKSAYDTDNLLDVSTPQIRTWLAELMNDHISAGSVHRKLSALKSFYKYQIKQGHLKQNPTTGTVSPKMKKRLPVFVEERKMNQLLSEKYDNQDFNSVRNHLIIELFYATGIRVSELTELKEKDIDLHEKTMKVLGKRNKERILPLTDLACILISDYRHLKTDNNLTSDHLIISKKDKPMNRNQLYQIVKTFLGGTELDKRSPHVLRHTFATHVLNHGADLNAVKELLGHSSLAATQVYTHNTIEKLKQTYNNAHPRA